MITRAKPFSETRASGFSRIVRWMEQTIGDRLAELRSGRDLCQDAVLDALPVCDLDKDLIRQRFAAAPGRTTVVRACARVSRREKS